MLVFFKLLITSFVGFLALDYIWLNLIAKKFYFENMQDVARIQNGQIQVTVWAGLIVYVLLSVGIIHFILPSVKADEKLFSIFLTGAYLGLVIYGVYDMTNLATLKNWPINLVLADIAWGAFVTGVVTLLTNFILNF